MKLLFCFSCGDLFNLKLTLKQCSCGKTKGQYINNEEAEVNGEGASIAIGNGSLFNAISFAQNTESVDDWRNTSSDPYARQPNSIICWARQHEGPSNPHTKINKGI